MNAKISTHAVDSVAIYISENGNDQKDGDSELNAVKTILQGLRLAQKKTVRKLILLPGKYEAPITMISGIDICGKNEIAADDLIYNSEDARSIDIYKKKYAVLVNAAEGAVVTARNIVLPTLLSNVVIIGKDDVTCGYGILVSSDKKMDKPMLRFQHIKIIPGKGKNGVEGAKTPVIHVADDRSVGGKHGYNTDAFHSFAPKKGVHVKNAIPGGAAGKNGIGYIKGDGKGYYNPGSKLPYNYGDTKRWNVYLNQGSDGGAGHPGTTGLSGKANADVYGYFEELVWKGQHGGAAKQGISGSGGGGGGAGACYEVNNGWNYGGDGSWGSNCYANIMGMKGGDGGNGGAGGYGAGGGEAGAASIGMVIVNDIVDLENVVILKSPGGDGAQGGAGGEGASGNYGVAGEIPHHPNTCSATDRWPGKGGNGGNGGKGGWGGGGAGGNGGISLGIALVKGAEFYRKSGIFCILGSKAGKGGNGGLANKNVWGETGNNGMSALMYEFQ